MAEILKTTIEELDSSAAEYEEITASAHADGHIDAEEERLLYELSQLIAEGAVKRVRG